MNACRVASRIGANADRTQIPWRVLVKVTQRVAMAGIANARVAVTRAAATIASTFSPTKSLTASTSPVPDVVALAASGDPGYVDIPG